jgi:hypothetical protein
LSASCTGDACDPNLYLSEQTAICAAQGYGLSLGIAECTAIFSPRDTSGASFNWTAHNVKERACIDGEWGLGSGRTVTIDAVTGEFLSEGAYAD